MEIRHYKIEDTYQGGMNTGSWTKLVADGFGQLSLVEIAPLTMQGWHVHGERDEWHVCIKGQVLVCQAQGQAVPSSPVDRNVIFIPKLIPHALYNGTEETAWILVVSDQPHDVEEDSWPMGVTEAELDALGTIWDNFYPESDNHELREV